MKIYKLNSRTATFTVKNNVHRKLQGEIRKIKMHSKAQEEGTQLPVDPAADWLNWASAGVKV